MSLAIFQAVLTLIDQGVTRFAAGGALGFDTIAARVVLSCRVCYPQVRLILVLPCPEQSKNWSQQDVEVYQEVLEEADEVIYTADHYHNGCMHLRNRRLVDMSRHCIYYMTHQGGGTAYTVDYAETQGLEMVPIELAEQDV